MWPSFHFKRKRDKSFGVHIEEEPPHTKRGPIPRQVLRRSREGTGPTTYRQERFAGSPFKRPLQENSPSSLLQTESRGDRFPWQGGWRPRAERRGLLPSGATRRQTKILVGCSGVSFRRSFLEQGEVNEGRELSPGADLQPCHKSRPSSPSPPIQWTTQSTKGEPRKGKKQFSHATI